MAKEDNHTHWRQLNASLADFNVGSIQILEPGWLIAHANAGLIRTIFDWIIAMPARRPLCLCCDTVFSNDDPPLLWALPSIHPPAIELYLDERYFAFTEERLPEMPADPQVVGIGTLRWLLDVAGPAFAPRQGRDHSRSGAACRLAMGIIKAGRAAKTSMQPCAPIQCWSRG
jgi:hypothetical protein